MPGLSNLKCPLTHSLICVISVAAVPDSVEVYRSLCRVDNNNIKSNCCIREWCAIILVVFFNVTALDRHIMNAVFDEIDIYMVMTYKAADKVSGVCEVRRY